MALFMNEEMGAFLPSKMKYCNYKHLANLDEIQYRQGCFHIEQISKALNNDYKRAVNHSNCQFHFINGDLDEHTPSNNIKDVCTESNNTSFYTIEGAGHFLDLEGKISKEQMGKVFENIFNKIGG